MPLLIESIAEQQTVEDLLREVIISSFGILLGIVFRDFVVSITAVLSPDNKTEQILYSFFVLLICLLVTLIIIIAWR